MATLLLARPGINRAVRAWGSAMRQRYNTTRSRGAATTGLSYWDDNQAGYSFWSVDHMLDVWGRPEDIFVDLIAAYGRLGIRFQSWETDQNFLGTMCPLCKGNGFGWCWDDVSQWNTTLFPSGMELYNKLGGLPMVYYISTMCRDNVYRLSSEGGKGGKYRFLNISGWTGDVLNAVVHPDDAHAAYTDMLTPLKHEGNMQMLFTDFLCWRGPEVQRQLPAYFEADHRWLTGMTVAAQDLGLEIQYCMACAHQALDSLRWPAVTNMRANGDGGLAVPDLAHASLLQGALGLGFSKDNLRLSNCSVPPCDGAYGEGAAHEAQLQTLLAALSLGPVGLADQLFGLPHTGVGVNTNVSLAQSLASSAGFLLQPSFPLTPIDPCIAEVGGLSPQSGNVWATYTAVSGLVWWTAVGWSWDGDAALALPSSRSDSSSSSSASAAGYVENGDPPALLQFRVLPAHLAPLIDVSTPISGDFSAVPKGAFVGDGTMALAGSSWVSWDSTSSEAVPFGVPGVAVRLEKHLPHQVNIAPVVDGVALLGEKAKVAAVSTYRFQSVVARGAGGLTVTLRGETNESVTLLFARNASGFQVERKLVVIGPSGTASVTLP